MAPDVPAPIMDQLAMAVHTTMARFAVIEDTRMGSRKVLATEFGLDPSVDRKHRTSVVTVLDA